MSYLEIAVFTAGDRNRLFTHANTFPICPEDNQSLLGNHDNQGSIPLSSCIAGRRQSHESNEKERNLHFAQKVGKQLHLQPAGQTGCGSPPLSGVSDSKGNSGLRVLAWSPPPPFCNTSPPRSITLYLQKMGLVQRRLEARSRFLCACPAITRPARVLGPEPSFCSNNSNPQPTGQRPSFQLKQGYTSNLRLLFRYGMKGSGLSREKCLSHKHEGLIPMPQPSWKSRTQTHTPVSLTQETRRLRDR